MNRVMLLVLSSLACFRLATPVEIIAQGGCSCGIFSEPQPAKPLIEHKLSFNVSCDKEGAERCQQLCIALAQSAKEQAPALICGTLNRHVENLKVSVYTNACNANTWRFTGLQSDPICCHEGKEMACKTTTTVASV